MSAKLKPGGAWKPPRTEAGSPWGWKTQKGKGKGKGQARRGVGSPVRVLPLPRALGALGQAPQLLWAQASCSAVQAPFRSSPDRPPAHFKMPPMRSGPLC